MRFRRLFSHALVLATSLMLTSSMVAAVAAPQGNIVAVLPDLQEEKSVPGKPVPVRALPPGETEQREMKEPAKVEWPKAATGEVELPPGAAPAPAQEARKPGQSVDHRKVGDLPVAVGRSRAAVGVAADKRVGKVRVEMFGQTEADKAALPGVVLKVTDAGGVTGDTISVRVDYGGFAEAYGGDYGSRLRLVRLPACALTTPDKSECRTTKPLPTNNNVKSKQITAEVPIEQSDGGAVVLGAEAASSGSGGTWTATSLAPSGSWSAGGSSGDFTYSVPLRTPKPVAGAALNLSLGYSSGGVDGRTSTTNNQASIVGDGWDLSASGFIERRYKSCGEDLDGNNGKTKTADQCWATENATLMLNGVSTELVLENNVWRPKRDDGSRIEKKYGAPNGDDDGEYWKVTSTDGTQFFLGLNKLPGWSTGKPETNSTWTVPVFGNNKDEPCHKAAFADSSCPQAYRWNLDYSVDTHGNVTTYYYDKEMDRYSRNMNTKTPAEYVRSGNLRRIEYGLRSNDVYAAAPARVWFDTAERCLPKDQITCDPGQLKKETASHWPDVPFEQLCPPGPECTYKFNPSFFTRKRLVKVTTQVRRDDVSGDQWKDVDSWTLRHTFPRTAGDGLSPALWLAGVKHAGHVGGTADTPEVTFAGEAKPNRVDADEGIAPLLRYRIVRVVNEAGGLTEVRYSGPDCTRAGQKDKEKDPNNTKRCYPMYWAPDGHPNPIPDWFHKYVVEFVTEDDRTGGSSQLKTEYQYPEGGAWHFDQNDWAKAETRTWSEWRGYGKVRTITGDPSATRSVTETLHLRGMDGDSQGANAKRDVWVEDSEKGKIEDHERLQGFVRETVQYVKDGSGLKAVSASISDPELKGPKATNGDDVAFMMVTKGTRSRTLLDGDRWRRTSVIKTFDDNGLATQVDDIGDVDVTGDEKCTRTEYVSNDAAWIRVFAKRVWTVALPCASGEGTEKDITSDVKSYYDGQEFGRAPTKGDITLTERWNGTEYKTVSRSVYDDLGRAIENYDVNDAKATTSYSPVSGYPLRSITTTNSLGFASTQTFEPAWGGVTSEVGPNGERTDAEYDPLGRLSKVWLPGRSKANDRTPSSEFTYEIKNDTATVVTTKSLRDDEKYNTSYALYDGLLRPRQTQTPAVAGGRVLTDTWYDSRGLAYKTNAAYYNETAPAPQLHGVLDAQIPNQTVTEFDELARPTAVIYRKLEIPQWRTTTSYSGDRTNVIPPTGDTPTTVIKNAQGQIIERRQYHGSSTSGDHDATTYSFTTKGQLDKVEDSAGNEWRYEYDALGRKNKDIDPDRGTTTYTYNDLDQIVSTTDSLGKTVVHKYDVLGRKKSDHEGSEDGPKLAEWVYDTLKKGMVTSSSSFAGGHEYKHEVTEYDDLNRPKETSVVIPESEGNLAATYRFQTDYHAVSGLVASVSMPEAGGLDAERVYHKYNELGMPTETYGAVKYAQEHLYTKYGETLRLTLGDGAKKMWVSNEYEEGSRRLERTYVDRNVTPIQKVADRRYTRDAAGNITRIADTPDATPSDIQCFKYDHLRRMTSSFTPKSGDCGPAPTVAGLGGNAPYWLDFGYDKTGNRTSEVKHTPQGDTTRTYTYPEPGEAQPHTVRSIDQTGPQGTSKDEFTYDNTGNTKTRKVSGSTQTLDWDVQGRLEKVTGADGKSSSYVYGADGSRLLKKEPGSTTLYLNGMELSLDKATDTVNGRRYYAHSGGTVAVRGSKSGLNWMFGDHNGTGSASIEDKPALPVNRRYSDPFGNSRGQAPSSWPDDKGFVGGVLDASGLTRIGARDYDPATGRFLSVDPVMDNADPQQINGYAYSNNSPVTFSDPDGLRYCGPDGVLCGHNVGYSDKQLAKTRAAVRKYYDTKVIPKQRALDYRQRVARQRQLQEQRAAAAEAGISVEEYEKAKDVVASGKTWWDVIKENAADIVGDLVGYNDVRDCFTKMDLWACAGLIPWGKAIKLLKFADKLIGVIKLANKVQDQLDNARKLTKKVEGATARLTRSGCNSFMPGTRVVLADGSNKPIEQVKIGDQVLAADPASGQSSSREVVATIIGQGVKHMVEITVDGGLVTATDEHPFWLPDQHRWVYAKDLRAGSVLQTSAGTWTQVSAVRSWTAVEQVHNLTIDGLHTYHVQTGAVAVLNHNDEVCDIEEYGPYHRLESPTQSKEVAAMQEASGELWGKTPQWGAVPAAQAHIGPLPDGKRGIEFYAAVAPDDPRGMGSRYPAWRGPREGVRVEDDFAKIFIRVTKNTQT